MDSAAKSAATAADSVRVSASAIERARLCDYPVVQRSAQNETFDIECTVRPNPGMRSMQLDIESYDHNTASVDPTKNPGAWVTCM